MRMQAVERRGADRVHTDDRGRGKLSGPRGGVCLDTQLQPFEVGFQVHRLHEPVAQHAAKNRPARLAKDLAQPRPTIDRIETDLHHPGRTLEWDWNHELKDDALEGLP